MPDRLGTIQTFWLEVFVIVGLGLGSVLAGIAGETGWTAWSSWLSSAASFWLTARIAYELARRLKGAEHVVALGMVLGIALAAAYVSWVFIWI